MSFQMNPSSTKKAYSTPHEYAARQGAPVSAFIAAGYDETFSTHCQRPAWRFKTAGGYRYRFMDGAPGKTTYISQKGFKTCWYGLVQATLIAQKTQQPLLMVNGEAGVVVAQYHGLAAFCLSGGETTNISEAMVSELRTAYHDSIIIALDCDDAGRKGASKRLRTLIDAGFQAKAVDLQLGDKGDIADFCKLHAAQQLDTLLSNLPSINPDPPSPTLKHREYTAQIQNGTVDWPVEREYFWNNVVIPRIEQTTQKRQGKHFQCINPNHADHHPSARITERGVYICICGSQKRKTVVGWLGLDFMAWWKENRSHLFPSRKSNPKHNIQTPSTPERPIATVSSLAPPKKNYEISMQSGLSNQWGMGNWQDGVPDTVRTAWLTFYTTGVATIGEILNLALVNDAIDWEKFTRQNLHKFAVEHGYSIPNCTFAKYCKTCEGIFFSILEIEPSSKKTILKTEINSSGAGRKANYYSLIDLQSQYDQLKQCIYFRVWEKYHPTDGNTVISTFQPKMMDAIDGCDDREGLASDFAGEMDKYAGQQDPFKAKTGAFSRRRVKEIVESLDDPTVSALPSGWKIANQAQYVVAYAHALGKRFTGQRMSRNEWSRKLGISDNSVPSYLKRAGLGKLGGPQFEYVSVSTAENVVAKVRSKAKAVKAYPRFIVVLDQNGNEIRSERYDPDTAASTVKRLSHLGKSVEIKMQAASRYHIISDTPVRTSARYNPPGQHSQSATPKSARIYAFNQPRFDPNWIAGQFRLVLQKQGKWLGDWQFVDKDGVIVTTQDCTSLAELILGRSIRSRAAKTQQQPVPKANEPPARSIPPEEQL